LDTCPQKNSEHRIPQGFHNALLLPLGAELLNCVYDQPFMTNDTTAAQQLPSGSASSQLASGAPPTNPFASRRRRIGEWCIERLITGVASIAIILIFVILAFVLRESLPLFWQKPATTSTNAATRTPNDSALAALRPEIYNPEVLIPTREPSVDLKPDVYNPDVTLSEPRTPSTARQEETISGSEEITLDNVLGTAWQPVSTKPKFGIMPLIIGTAKTTSIAILLGAPLGILAALYAAFLAPKKLREFIKPMVEIVAGFPSVVIGFFCLLAIGSLTQALFGLEYRLNAFVGGIGLAIAVIPIVFTITEDSLLAVPNSLLEAALAMGATRWEAAYKVMLPAAFPGVFAAVLLGIGRAFGETMIALMATGNAALVSVALTDPARTLSATIGAEMGEVIWGSPHYSILFFLGILLFAVSFTLNAITELFVKERLAKKLQGG
jgi:phosphate transport system permease protein